MHKITSWHARRILRRLLPFVCFGDPLGTANAGVEYPLLIPSDQTAKPVVVSFEMRIESVISSQRRAVAISVVLINQVFAPCRLTAIRAQLLSGMVEKDWLTIPICLIWIRFHLVP